MGTINGQGKTVMAQLSPSLSEKLEFLWLEITNRCNLRCVHCYAGSEPTQPLTSLMKLKDWCRVLVEAASLGCRKVQFIGGEPTVYPHIRKLISEAREIGFDFIEVYTNGTNLNEKLCSFLKANEVNLAYSLYGSQPFVHDAITTRPGSFIKKLEGIKRALKYDIPIRIGIIKMDENCHDIDNTMGLLNSLGIKNYRIDRVRGIGRGKGQVKPLNPFDELCGSCWKGKLAVNANGNVGPCVFSHFCNLGQVTEGLASILKKPELIKFRSRFSGKEESTACNPPECQPRCFPNNCDPDICDPINCTPLD
ncbi:hypothetical protein UR09_01320 [Candidatus Nitromaritima sp. SCGC AAA799-A02]|nr:hypothetical protein UR09_01320 [Candidatus Nitromaritima sp. SCGC AAA799-A02]